MPFLTLGLLISVQSITNASFEKLQPNGAPGAWVTQTWGGSAKYAIADFGRTGKHCAFIDSQQGVDGGWQAQVPVKPFSKYRLTAWIKTENVIADGNRGALINLHARPEHTTPLKGTNDWTKVSLTVDTGSDDVLLVNCLMGYFGQAKGKAWFDDLSLELLSTTEMKPSVTIDASKTREPISPYIYSQFIEHLGKCIYGGIWAEMLEDRKFFYQVGSKESPWKQLVHGVAQEGLWLEKGRRYVGYIILRDNGATVSIDGKTLPITQGEAFKHEFSFAATETTKNGRLEITWKNRSPLRAVSLMPADNVRGMRRDTLKLLKELNAPLYRWPGGNFVSGYNWQDGIGDRDSRPTRKNPAWQGIEPNDFGIREFMDFCKEVGAEPLVVVNTGLGSVEMARQELEYINGSPDSPMGKLRERNGNRQPWKVKWWGVGNEMYGDWQLGHVPLAQYTLRHNEFATAMRKQDPSIKLIAVGDNYSPWTRGMFEKCAQNMDLVSEHFYSQERPGVLAHTSQIAEQIRNKATIHRRLQQELPAAKRIKIAMDEWNYWYGDHVYGELGTRYFWKDGIGIARGLHEFFRSTDVIYMANYAQTVNVIGAVKTNPFAAEMETTGLVLALYRNHFGSIPLDIVGDMQPLDVSAALSTDGKRFTLAIINPTPASQKLSLAIKGIDASQDGKRWTIANQDAMAFNSPGTKRNLKIEEGSAPKLGNSIEAKPYSVTIWSYATR